MCSCITLKGFWEMNLVFMHWLLLCAALLTQLRWSWHCSIRWMLLSIHLITVVQLQVSGRPVVYKGLLLVTAVRRLVMVLLRHNDYDGHDMHGSTEHNPQSWTHRISYRNEPSWHKLVHTCCTIETESYTKTNILCVSAEGKERAGRVYSVIAC